MEIATEQRPPVGLRLARHAAGMCVVALANPLIYFDQSPFEQWAMLPIGAASIAAALFGVLALISPERAKAAWPATPIRSAWFILALMLFANWQTYRAPSGAAPQQKSGEWLSPHPELKPFNGQIDRPSSQSSQIDDFLSDAPAQKNSNPFSDPNFGKELLPK